MARGAPRKRLNDRIKRKVGYLICAGASSHDLNQIAAELIFDSKDTPNGEELCERLLSIKRIQNSNGDIRTLLAIQHLLTKQIDAVRKDDFRSWGLLGASPTT